MSEQTQDMPAQEPWLLHMQSLPEAELNVFYEQVRQEGPVQDSETGIWLVGNYADVRIILGKPKEFLSRDVLRGIYPPDQDTIDVLMQIIHYPDTTAASDNHELHRRVRQVADASFATKPKKLENDAWTQGVINGHIKELADDLPNKADNGRVDLLAAYAKVLPLVVNIDLLGLPKESYGNVSNWSDGQIALGWGLPKKQFAEGLVSLANLCKETIEQRVQAKKHAIADGKDPRSVLQGNDMATRMVLDGRLDDDAMINVLLNVAVAGHETTANGIGDGIHKLLATKGAWKKLSERAKAGDTEYVSNLADELIDKEAPIHGWLRTTAKEVVIRGVTIPKGAKILMLLRAANQDPERKETDGTLSFGHGIHYCLGAAVARREVASTLQVLAERFPDLQLAPQSELTAKNGEWKQNAGFRALGELMVTGVLEAVPQAT